MVQSAGDFILAGLFPDMPDRMEAIHSLLAVCSKILRATSAVDSNNREELDALKLEVVLALCHCEAEFPRTEMAVMFHILLHVPDAIYRWNNVRNFWSVFGERYQTRSHISFASTYVGLMSYCICSRRFTLFDVNLTSFLYIICYCVGLWATLFASSTTATWRRRTS